jgi:hypothetical protein
MILRVTFLETTMDDTGMFAAVCGLISILVVCAIAYGVIRLAVSHGTKAGPPRFRR